MSEFQLTCPNCKHEFKYNRGYYDREIARLSAELTSIEAQLANYKTISQPTREQRRWRKSAIVAKNIKVKDITELKAFRKLANENLARQIDSVFNRKIKDMLGEPEYIRLREESEKIVHAYDIKDLAKTTFTSATGKGAINISKL